MSQPIITVEGRRVYIQTRYGDPCVSALKRLGAHWDGESKRWWLTSAKKAEVEKAIAASAGKPNTAEAEREVTVVGKARYKGRNYYVRWVGQTKSGDYKARLCSLDAKLDFWVKAAQPHEYQIDGSGDVARVTKTYEEARSLDGIRRYIERLKEAKDSGAGEKPDEECYLGPRGEWLVKGCAECASLGTMCRSCRHDIYDN